MFLPIKYFCWALDIVQQAPYILGMALTPERKVKDLVVAQLKARGAYYFFPASNGFGRMGIPDIIVCHHGSFIAIECKAGKGKTTRLQDRELDNINKAGGVAIVINETNIALVTRILTSKETNHARKATSPPTP